MRLIEVEARRFIYRDTNRLIGFLLLLALAVVGIGAFITSNPIGPSDAAKFDRLITAERKRLPEAIERCSKTRLIDLIPENTRQNMDEEMRRRFLRKRTYAECRSSLAYAFIAPRSSPTPGARAQASELQRDTRFHLVNFPIAVRFAIFAFWIVSWVLGATMIGAEWSAGSMRNILTWEPRRLRMMAAKMMVPAFIGGIGYVVFFALLVVSVLPTVVVKGTSVGVDALWWTETLLTALRGSLMTVVGVLFGFGLCMLIRRTIAAVGVLFLYFMVVENVIRQFTREFEGWMLTTNLAVISTGFDFSPEGRPFLVPVLIIGGYLVILLGIATLLFVRRDAD